MVFAVYKGEKKMKQISDGSKRTLQVTKKERKKKGRMIKDGFCSFIPFAFFFSPLLPLRKLF